MQNKEVESLYQKSISQLYHQEHYIPGLGNKETDLPPSWPRLIRRANQKITTVPSNHQTSYSKTYEHLYFIMSSLLGITDRLCVCISMQEQNLHLPTSVGECVSARSTGFIRAVL